MHVCICVSVNTQEEVEECGDWRDGEGGGGRRKRVDALSFEGVTNKWVISCVMVLVSSKRYVYRRNEEEEEKCSKRRTNEQTSKQSKQVKERRKFFFPSFFFWGIYRQHAIYYMFRIYMCVLCHVFSICQSTAILVSCFTNHSSVSEINEWSLANNEAFSRHSEIRIFYKRCRNTVHFSHSAIEKNHSSNFRIFLNFLSRKRLIEIIKIVCAIDFLVYIVMKLFLRG